MTDQKQSNRIVCTGGLDTTFNFLSLSSDKPGCATRLTNYEVGIGGGYRRVNGYAAYDMDFAEVGVGVAEGKVLGIIIFDNTATGTTDIIAARKTLSATTYKFYKYTLAGWVAIATGLTHNYSVGPSTVEKVRWTVCNDGAKNYLVTVDGLNNAVIYDGTSWAFIDSADTGADIAHAGGNQVIDAPNLVTFFSKTLFLGNDTLNDFEGIVAYSAPNAFYKWTAAGGAGQIPAGFEVVDFKPFRSSLFTFGENAISAIVPDTTAGFLLKVVTTNIGLVARDGIVEIGGDLVFLAPDGFRPVSGTDKIGDVELESLSKPIHQLIVDRVRGNQGLSVNSVVIRSKSQFRFLFGTGSIAVGASKGIMGALRTSDQATGWEFGELLGFRANCITSRYIDGEEFVLAGDYDGCVYRHDFGDDLNGDVITHIYSTPYLDFGDTEIAKVMEKITTFMIGEGDIDLTLTLSYDWGRPEVLSPSGYPINITATIPTYDGGYLYDQPGVQYGGVLSPVVVQNVEGSFWSVRITYSGSDSNPPHSIFAIIAEYALAGRRAG
jgi:hypothetical protein